MFSDDSAKMYCMQFSPTAPRLVLGASNGCIHVYNTEVRVVVQYSWSTNP